MPPQPNTENKVISLHDADVTEQQFVVVDYDSHSSSDEQQEEANPPSQYAGYKLLLQDDAQQVANDDTDSDDDTDNDNDENNKDGGNYEGIEVDVAINYDDLVCSGIDDNPCMDNTLFLSNNNIETECSFDVSNKDTNESLQSMTKEHVEQVKIAMSGFLLPSVNIPEWAKNISDEEWKKSIVDSVKNS